MPAGSISPLIAALVASRPLAILLALGFLTLFVLVAVLVWIAFWPGPAALQMRNPFALRSFAAADLCLQHAYSLWPARRWTGHIVHVRLRDAADNVEAAPAATTSPKPWHQAGKPDVPLLLSPPEKEKTAEPPPKESEKPKQEVVADHPPHDEPKEAPPVTSIAPIPRPPRDQPRLTDLLPDTAAEKQSPPEPATPVNPLRNQPVTATELLPRSQPALLSRPPATISS